MTKALAYLLITTKHGHSQKVAEDLMNFEEVQNIHELFGQWDLIVKILTESNEKLSDFVHDNVMSIPEVQNTETLVVSDIPKEG